MKKNSFKVCVFLLALLFSGLNTNLLSAAEYSSSEKNITKSTDTVKRQGIGVPINENFDDEDLINYIVGKFNTHSGAIITQQMVNDLTEISIDKPLDKGTRGIETFTNLKTLVFKNSELRSIDLSSLRNLEKLELNKAFLNNGIDLSQNTKLKELKIDLVYDGNLKKLDISSLNNLLFLEITNAGLETIDFGEITSLQSINLSNNQLVDIDFKVQQNLGLFDLSNNQLINLPKTIKDSFLNINGKKIKLVNNLLPAGYGDEIRSTDNYAVRTIYENESQNKLIFKSNITDDDRNVYFHSSKELNASVNFIKEILSGENLSKYFALSNGQRLSEAHNFSYDRDNIKDDAGYYDQLEDYLDIDRGVKQDGLLYIPLYSKSSHTTNRSGLFDLKHTTLRDNENNIKHIYIHFVNHDDYKLEYIVDGEIYHKDDKIMGYSILTAPEAPKKDGYSFVGWFNKDVKVNFEDSTVRMPDKDLQLIAKFSANDVRLTFNLNGGTSTSIDSKVLKVDTTYGSDITPPERFGYSFVEWNTNQDGSGDTWDLLNTVIKRDTTIYAQWKADTYKLNFVTGTSDVVEPQDVDFDSLAKSVNNVNKEGYTLKEWNTEADGTGTAWDFETSKMPASDVTLYAQWSINKYILSFDLNGATSEKIESQSIEFDSHSTAIAKPNAEGRNFKEWNTQADGSGTTWNFETSKMPAYHVTLYAQWENNSYKLSFDLNGVQGTEIAEQTVEFNSLSTAVNNPTVSGKQFKEWNTKADGTGTAWNFETSKMPGKDITLYAQWTNNTYKLYFNLNGGSSKAIAAQSVSFSATAKNVSNPTRFAYTFTGWNTSKDGKGTKWSLTSTKMPAKNVTLYAQWTRKYGTSCITSGYTKTCYTYTKGYKDYSRYYKTVTHKNKKLSYRQYTYKNKYGKYTSVKKYYYNKIGQLKSNKYGNSYYKYYTYFSNNKVAKYYIYKYNSKGKAVKTYYKYYSKNKPR